MNEIKHTSTVLMCLSRGSKEEVELTASSSFSFSLIHREKASDSLLKRSHHIHIISNWTTLENTKSGISMFTVGTNKHATAPQTADRHYMSVKYIIMLIRLIKGGLG